MKVFIKAGGVAKPYEVEFEGGNFGELKAAAAAQGHSIVWNNTNTIVNSSRTMLLSDDSLVPQEANLVLMVVTKKSAAGADYSTLGRNALLGVVKQTIASDGQSAREFFSNYPQKPSSVIVDLLNDYFGSEAGDDEVDVEEVLDALDAASAAIATARELVANISSGTVAEQKFGGYTQAQLDEDHARATALTL